MFDIHPVSSVQPAGCYVAPRYGNIAGPRARVKASARKADTSAKIVVCGHASRTGTSTAQNHATKINSRVCLADHGGIIHRGEREDNAATAHTRARRERGLARRVARCGSEHVQIVVRCALGGAASDAFRRAVGLRSATRETKGYAFGRVCWARRSRLVAGLPKAADARRWRVNIRRWRCVHIRLAAATTTARGKHEQTERYSEQTSQAHGPSWVAPTIDTKRSRGKLHAAGSPLTVM